MPYKDPNDPRKKENLRKSSARYYASNKEKVQAATNKNKKDNRKLWNEFKATQKCSTCGANHPAVIDFHHVVRDHTKQSVHHLAKNGQYKRAMEEIKKCIPLCANCHRIHHYEERKAKKAAKKK